ncbi:MAG TPA: gliding motility-associated C-terminal domain-containing protein [Bacteroidia bacterium]|jgi:gliding motility-associated-like protein|nr:gliding motility-associated C-terminal domain-containing protein [Bacteroidia bacterium]
MRYQRFTLLLFLLLLFAHARGQITVTNADMPNANDEILLSIKNTLTNFKPALTGPNYTWDYSTLVPDSQRTEKMVAPGTTGYPFVGFASTYAIPDLNPDPFPFILLGTAPTNVYNFYKKSTSQLTISIQGITMNTTPLPIFLNPADVIYKFPLTYGNKDSSNSGYENMLPGFGYFKKSQKRVNTVDGWGTLKTPFGTFDVIRVKSVIFVTDSIHSDSLGFGLNIPLPTKYEYKWLAKGSKLPILEIDATQTIGTLFNVTNVAFQDQLATEMVVSLTSAPTCSFLNQGTVQAVVSGGHAPYTYKWSNGQSTAQIDNLKAGEYTLTVEDSYKKTAKVTAIVEALADESGCLKIPNGFTPDNDGVNDVWNIRGLNEFKNCKVQVFNQWGALVFISKGYDYPWDGKYNNAPVEAGTYYYVIDLGNDQKEYTGNVTVIK